MLATNLFRTTTVNGTLREGTIDFSEDMANYLNAMPGSQFHTNTHRITTHMKPEENHYSEFDVGQPFYLQMKSKYGETELARLQVFQTPFMEGGVVEFHSHTNPDHRGKGYNKILKGVLANLAEEEGMAKYIASEYNRQTRGGEISKQTNQKYLGMVPGNYYDLINNMTDLKTAAGHFLNQANPNYVPPKLAGVLRAKGIY